nr:hypothetical protein StreXyl84_66810 [Streptomyces sp. Xyl84]
MSRGQERRCTPGEAKDLLAEAGEAKDLRAEAVEAKDLLAEAAVARAQETVQDHPRPCGPRSILSPVRPAASASAGGLTGAARRSPRPGRDRIRAQGRIEST